MDRRGRPEFEGPQGGGGGPGNLVLGEELASWDSLLSVVKSRLACANGPFWTAGCGRWVERTACYWGHCLGRGQPKGGVFGTFSFII